MQAHTTADEETVKCSFSLDRDVPHAGQTFSVTLTCNQLPDPYTTDLESPGVEMLSMSSLKTDDSYQYIYRLRAVKAGDYTISCPNLSFDGTPYRVASNRFSVKAAPIPWVALAAILLPLCIYFVVRWRTYHHSKVDFAAFVLSTGRMNLRVETAHRHFLLPSCLLVIPFATGAYTLATYFMGEPLLLNAWLIGGLILLPLLLSLGMGYFQYRRLFFTPVNTQLPICEIYNLIAELGAREQWTCSHPGQDYYSCRTNPQRHPSILGEQIYLVFDKGRVWVNSVCDLTKGSFGSGFGRTRRNISLVTNGICNWEKEHVKR
jgi:rhomboid protease GluP